MRKKLVLVLVAVGLMVAVASGDLLTNGDFEADAGSIVNTVAPTGWDWEMPYYTSGAQPNDTTDVSAIGGGGGGTVGILVGNWDSHANWGDGFQNYFPPVVAGTYTVTVTYAVTDPAISNWFRVALYDVIDNSDPATVWASGNYTLTSDSPWADVATTVDTWHTANFKVTATAPSNTLFFNTGGAYDPGNIIIGAISMVSPAWEPDPYDGQLGVPLDQILSWKTAIDPNTGLTDSKITAHELYMNDGTSDPSLYLVDTITATGDTGQYTQGGEWLIGDGATYLWRIDEVGGPNTITGNVWAFETRLSVPVIDAATPADALVYPGEDAVFTVSAVNPLTGDNSDLSYQWYEVGVGPIGTNSPTLTIANAQIANEGEYYCTVTIGSSSATADSRSASLGIKRLIVHWKLDETSGTTAADSSPSGYGYAGTLVGFRFNNSSVDGQVGNALEFSSNDVMTIGAPDIPVPWTAGMWVKKTGTGVLGTLLASDIASLRLYQWPDTGKVGLTRAGVADWTFDYSAPLDEWTHLVFVGTSSGTNLYVNGTLMDSMANVIECPMDALGVDTDELSADIDDVRVYNYDLDPYAIAQIFVDDKPGEVVCVEYPKYDFNEDCVVNLADSAELAFHWMECNSVPDCLP